MKSLVKSSGYTSGKGGKNILAHNYCTYILYIVKNPAKLSLFAMRCMPKRTAFWKNIPWRLLFYIFSVNQKQEKKLPEPIYKDILQRLITEKEEDKS